MNTEADLRDLLLRLERDAPPVEQVLAGLEVRTGTRPRRPRAGPRAVVAAAAVAAAVVAVAVAVLPTAASRQGDTAGGTAGLLSPAELVPAWRFSVGRVPGFTVTADEIIRVAPAPWQQQGAAVVATSGRVSGRVVVQIDSPGGWSRQLEQTVATPGRRTTVAGNDGYFSTPSTVRATGTDAWSAATDDPQSQPQLLWRLPGGSWAMLLGTFGYRPATRDYDAASAEQQMKRIAAAVHVQRPDRVRRPFRLHALPNGLVPTTVRDFGRAAYCLGLATVRDLDATDKGADVLVCRVRTATQQPGPFATLLRSDPMLVRRPLPDGSDLRVLAVPGSAVLGLSSAATLLREADSSYRLDAPASWPRAG